MKYAKNVMYLAVLGAVLSSTTAWASWKTYEDKPSPHPDGGSRLVAKQQDRNTWQDWFWKGSSEGMVFRCPPDHPNATCDANYEVNQSKSTSVSKSWSVGAGGQGGAWFAKAQPILMATYGQTTTKTNTTGKSFRGTVQVKKGEYTMPVSIQNRRWKTGVFNGGHYQINKWEEKTARKNVTRTRYEYEWYWRDFGKWTDNRAENSAYFSMVYSKKGF
jgi:hypothetical protein